MKSVAIKVVETRGSGCENSYCVGQKWNMIGNHIPGDFCVGAMSALLPWLTCLVYESDLPWSENGVIRVCCTDPDHPVVFELKAFDDNEHASKKDCTE